MTRALWGMEAQYDATDIQTDTGSVDWVLCY